jgi:hypothetical protein
MAGAVPPMIDNLPFLRLLVVCRQSVRQNVGLGCCDYPEGKKKRTELASPTGAVLNVKKFTFCPFIAIVSPNREL